MTNDTKTEPVQITEVGEILPTIPDEKPTPVTVPTGINHGRLRGALAEGELGVVGRWGDGGGETHRGATLHFVDGGRDRDPQFPTVSVLHEHLVVDPAEVVLGELDGQDLARHLDPPLGRWLRGSHIGGDDAFSEHAPDHDFERHLVDEVHARQYVEALAGATDLVLEQISWTRTLRIRLVCRPVQIPCPHKQNSSKLWPPKRWKQSG